MYLFTWLAVPILVALACLVRAFLDLRARRYVWAVIEVASAGALLAMPVPTQSVTIDLDQAAMKAAR